MNAIVTSIVADTVDLYDGFTTVPPAIGTVTVTLETGRGTFTITDWRGERPQVGDRYEIQLDAVDIPKAAS